jgi:uncharacterized SAM-dependent methyltransferase
VKNYDKQFLIDSVALLQHKRSSHMGAHQYADHSAMRGGFAMSGALGWKRYEKDCPGYYILRCENDLIGSVSTDIGEYLEQGTSLIDLGTGTLEAVRSKSLPLAKALHSNTYVPIDNSLKFCSEAGSVIREALPDTAVEPCIENFFADDVEPALDVPALGFLGGITIANIEAPLSATKPTAQLVQSLKNIARITGGGWLLLSTDANQSEIENKAMYSENGLFEINTFDRMAHELPLTGLDPKGIVYEPVWIKESGQLGHTGVAVKDMNLSFNASEYTGNIRIKTGDRFHLKNSFKYTDEYFLSCAAQAGYEPLKVWTHPEKPLRLFLLKAPAIEHVSRQKIVRPIYQSQALKRA